MDSNNSSVIYTGTQRLFRSTDKGRNWEVISGPLVNSDNPSGNLNFGTLTSITVSEHNGDHVYVGTDDGNLWRTLDYGETYQNISVDLPERWVTSIAVDPWLESGLYVTFSGFRFGESKAQVFYSDDYGDSWQDYGSNLPDIPVNDIVIDDIKANTVYLACDVGVYYTEDRGDSWELLDDQLPNVPIIDIDYHKESRYLVAASYGRGMYKYPLGLPSSNINLSAEAFQLYPNPANSIIHIDTEYNVKEIRLYDLQSRLVLKNTNFDEIFVGGLKSGTYVVQVITDKGFALKKAVILIQ